MVIPISQSRQARLEEGDAGRTRRRLRSKEHQGTGRRGARDRGPAVCGEGSANRVRLPLAWPEEQAFQPLSAAAMFSSSSSSSAAATAPRSRPRPLRAPPRPAPLARSPPPRLPRCPCALAPGPASAARGPRAPTARPGQRAVRL
nr:translation initiation factor IF-2-like [Manis javanica]